VPEEGWEGGLEMPNWDKASNWVRMLVGYSIAFIVLVILRTVILSLHGVRTLGFVVEPFQTMAYPLGLLGMQLLDMLFRTVFIFVVLAFGGSLNRAISSSLPRVPHLGRIASLGMGLVALAVGYYAYRPLLLPPLISQGAEWAYGLIFWVFVAGISAFMLFEFVRMISELRASEDVQSSTPATTPTRAMRPEEVCRQCGSPVLQGSHYCFACGTSVAERAPSEVPAAATTASPRPDESPSSAVQGAITPEDAALLERVVRLTRTTAPGVTGRQILGQLLELDAEFTPYRALLVTFVSPSPNERKTRYLAIPSSQPLEATALDVVGPETVAGWDSVALEGLAILIERSN